MTHNLGVARLFHCIHVLLLQLENLTTILYLFYQLKNTRLSLLHNFVHQQKLWLDDYGVFLVNMKQKISTVNETVKHIIQ